MSRASVKVIGCTETISSKAVRMAGVRDAKTVIASSLMATRYRQPGTSKMALISLRNDSARSLSRILSISSMQMITRQPSRRFQSATRSL